MNDERKPRYLLYLIKIKTAIDSQQAFKKLQLVKKF